MYEQKSSRKVIYDQAVADQPQYVKKVIKSSSIVVEEAPVQMEAAMIYKPKKSAEKEASS